MEDFFDWNGDGRVVFWIYLHNISHHVPPFLSDRVDIVRILRTAFALTLLVAKEDIGFLILKDAIVGHTSILNHLYQLRPDGGMAFLILFLTTWFQVHLKSKSFHISIFFLVFINCRQAWLCYYRQTGAKQTGWHRRAEQG